MRQKIEINHTAYDDAPPSLTRAERQDRILMILTMAYDGKERIPNGLIDDLAVSESKYCEE